VQFVDKNIVDKNIVDKNIVDKNIVDKNIVDKNIVDKNIVDCVYQKEYFILAKPSKNFISPKSEFPAVEKSCVINEKSRFSITE